jgi:hypothetical protein
VVGDRDPAVCAGCVRHRRSLPASRMTEVPQRACQPTSARLRRVQQLSSCPGLQDSGWRTPDPVHPSISPLLAISGSSV